MRNGGSRMPAPTPSAQPAVSQPAVTIAKQSQEVVNTAAPVAQAAVSQAAPTGAVKDLKESVMDLLQREIENKPEGVPLSFLCAQLKGSAESEVKAIMEKLVEDGDVFNTI